MTLRPCGTQAAYYRHRRRGETPCAGCRQAATDYEADRRRRLGRPSRASWRPPACGTPAGYQYHRRLGEPTCRQCRDAWNHDQQQRRVAKAQRPQSIPGCIADVLETAGISMSWRSLSAWVVELHPEWAETTVKRTLERLVKEGRVERVEFGDELRYRL